MTIPTASLFETAYTSPLAAATELISGTLIGSVALTLCVIAIFAIGLMMLTGRLPLRQGMRVVIGCFVLLGAPAIALGLTGLGQGTVTSEPLPPPPTELAEPREEMPPAQYDPYAGASLRSD